MSIGTEAGISVRVPDGGTSFFRLDTGMEQTSLPPLADAAPAPRRGLLSGWRGLVLRLAATVLLMAYVLRGISWGKFAALVANADWQWWIAGLVTGIAVQVAAGVRWAALARPLGFPFSRRFFVWRFFEGSFFSLCLPGSIGGDVVKAYRVGDTRQRRLLAGCSVLADRLTGLAALGVLAGAAFAGAKYGLPLAATLAVGGVLLLLTLTVFMGGVASIDRLLTFVPAPHPAREFIARLMPYQQRPILMAQAVGWSFIVQMGGAAAVGLMARSLGVKQPLSIWFAVVPLVALAVVLPISINGVGVRENALAVLLAPYGVAAESAVAVGLLWLASQIVTGLIGGGLFLIDRQAAMPDVEHP